MIKEFKMRASKVLNKLNSGRVALCTKMNLSDPRAVEIAAMSGVDCVWTCQEHVGTGQRRARSRRQSAPAHYSVAGECSDPG